MAFYWTRWIKSTLLTFLICCAHLGFAQPGDPLEKSKTYAKHLYNSGDYLEAIRELEKIQFQAPADEIALPLLSAYRKSSQHQIGIKRFNQIYADKEALNPELSMEFAQYLFEMGFYKDSYDFLLSHSDPNDTKTITMLSICAAQLFDYDAARKHLEGLDEKNNKRTSIEALLLKHQTQKKKSPLVAGALSTIIPGLGKVYTGHWKDGLISFVFIATSTWQSYVGFKNNGLQSVYGWIFGTIGTGFYLGNIYGSARSAQRKNKSYITRSLADFEKLYHNYFN